MSSIEDKLLYLQQTKSLIKDAIENKGQIISDTDTFRSYVDKINDINTGNGEVKLFKSLDELTSSTNNKEGDLAVVYRDEIQNMTSDTQTQFITFPETVVLPEAITSSYSCSYRYVDDVVMMFSVRLDDNSFHFSNRGAPRINITYSSTDGITYNRNKFTVDNEELTNPVDLNGVITIHDKSRWNDSFGYFMQFGGWTFDGLYEYNGTSYNIAPNQYSLISSNQLLSNISAYGKNGNITGDGSIETPDNTFADIPIKLYYNIQQKYNNMEPRVLTDEDKEINDNIYTIPTKSDGTVLLDTSQVTNMQSMFSGCSDLTEIPTLNTSNVTNMSYIFSSCSNLTKVSSLDTSNVTNMSCMFSGCSNLIDVPELNTSKVTDMGYMFSYCSNLTEIPIFDMSSVTDAYSMFGHCKSLVVAPELNLSNVTTTFDMFAGCTNLTTVPVFNISKINTPLRMFSDCPNLSNDSLNNILASCVTANSIIDADDKTLKYIGLSETQATTCATLSNWAACESAGWTTGY